MNESGRPFYPAGQKGLVIQDVKRLQRIADGLYAQR